MSDELLESAMRRALALAQNGPRGINPQVGCVILSPADEIIAEGWHRGVGTPHAEADALATLTPDQTRGATAVVTLEPCNHRGHTGPCSVALIESGIARVVYAVDDPTPEARGGAARLREAGVEVVPHVLADDVRAFLADWLFVAAHGRPHVALKWAMTLDGRIAAADGTSQWISSPEARAAVHTLREMSDAVLVGTGTVIADDPALTARGPAGELLAHQPVPVVVGERAVPAAARLFDHPVEPILEPTRDLAAALADLAARGILTVLAEPGPTLGAALVKADLVDRLEVFLGPGLLGGPNTALGDLGVGTIAAKKAFAIVKHAVVGDSIWVRAERADEKES